MMPLIPYLNSDKVAGSRGDLGGGNDARKGRRCSVIVDSSSGQDGRPAI